MMEEDVGRVGCYFLDDMLKERCIHVADRACHTAGSWAHDTRHRAVVCQFDLECFRHSEGIECLPIVRQVVEFAVEKF